MAQEIWSEGVDATENRCGEIRSSNVKACRAMESHSFELRVSYGVPNRRDMGEIEILLPPIFLALKRGIFGPVQYVLQRM